MLYDKDIREPLFDFLEEKYGKIRIIEEKQVGRSRADVVMVLPRAVCGIEIKSDADTYARLAKQVKDYNRYFDYNYIVAGTSHAMHVEEHVPDWWGIITVEIEDGRVDFYVLREARANPAVDWKRKLGILWRPELAHIQELNGMPKYRQKSKDFVVDKILLKVSKEALYQQISEELFERDYNEIQETIRKYRKGRKNK
ncbi:MAG: sce7726 family protein [Lachnospiraceae bacterium]|nr:sce7726 family protein [Lachnospiraceae bacterium]MDE6626006.1 sce7726 family protein [Lachnospiraceae bacterium]